MKTRRLLSTHPPQQQHGSAVLVLLAFLGLMMVLCATTTSVVLRSQKEIALIEKHQLARWATATNAPVATRSMSAP